MVGAPAASPQPSLCPNQLLHFQALSGELLHIGRRSWTSAPGLPRGQLPRAPGAFYKTTHAPSRLPGRRVCVSWEARLVSHPCEAITVLRSSHTICLFLSDLLSIMLSKSVLSHIAGFPSFSWINNILACIYTTSSLSVHQWALRLFPRVGYCE